MTRMNLFALVAAVLVSPGVSVAGAQEWRTMEVSRQLRDDHGAPHRVQIEYGAGRLELYSTSEPVFFTMRLRYSETAASPLHSYDAAQRLLRLGVSGDHVRGSRDTNRRRSAGGDLRIGLSRSVPVDLEVNVGAAKAELDLGGLNLSAARIHTGAADASVRFSSPNAGELRSLELEAGAASLSATGLANANTPSVRINAGVGNLNLSFDGAWTRDVTLDGTVALGKLTVRVPSDVGVRVDLRRVLASFDHPDLEKRGDAYYSANWDTAPFKLTVRAETVLGALVIDRIR